MKNFLECNKRSWNIHGERACHVCSKKINSEWLKPRHISCEITELQIKSLGILANYIVFRLFNSTVLFHKNMEGYVLRYSRRENVNQGFIANKTNLQKKKKKWPTCINIQELRRFVPWSFSKKCTGKAVSHWKRNNYEINMKEK